MMFPVKVACCAIASVICTQAQTPRYSQSTAYREMLGELHHDPGRPSRMGAGTLLSTANPMPDRKPVLETSGWRLEVGEELALTNKRTGLTWRVLIGGAEAPRGLKPAPQVDVISDGVIRVSLRSSILEIAGGGPFFGLGERFDRVKLDGLKTTLSPQDLLGQPNGHNWTYIPVPFLFTPRGLGVYLDTAAVSTFYIGDSGFSIRLANPSVDVYFFIGEPKKIIENYTALTGHSPMLPPWAFGIWICSYQGPDKVLAEAKRLREEGIPASAIWTFDAMGKGDIMGWPLWWTGYYPYPAQFTGKLHEMGFKVLTYVHPYLRSILDPYHLPNPAYEAGVRSGLFVLDAQS